MRRASVVLSLAAILGTAGLASAQPVRGVAWAHVTSGVVPLAFQYNSAHPEGGSITTTNPSPGLFQVIVPDLGTASGTAHVVAASGNHYCNVAGWDPSGADLVINVECYVAGGAPTGGSFNVFFYKESRSETVWSGGYLWADTPSTPLGTPYSPASSYSWNSKGLANSIVRNATGHYIVTMAGLGPLPAAPSVMVTAYGPSNSAHCRTDDYHVVGNDAVIDVSCESATGTPVNSQFTLSFFTDVAFGTDTGYEQLTRGGYMYLDQPTFASVTPDLRYQYLSSGQPIRATHIATGRTRVNLPATIAGGSAIVQVSRFGTPGYCTVPPWVADFNDGTNVDIECYSPAGVLEDARFVMLFMTNQPASSTLPTPGGPSSARAWTDASSATIPTTDPEHDFNSSGAANTVVHMGVGQYQVSFPNMGTASGIVQVSAHGTTAYCKAHSYGPVGTTQEVYVLCFDSAGEAVDSRFTVLFYRESRSAPSANGFARVMAPVSLASSTYAAPSRYSWNGTGGGVDVQRTAVGTYKVSFAGITVPPSYGSVLVTPYGATPTRCRPSSWGMPNVFVKCYDSTGALRDAEFGLSYFTDLAFGAASAAASDPGAYAWAHTPGATAYQPSTFFRFNSTGGTFLADRSGTGRFSMAFSGLKTTNKTIAFVTAYGAAGVAGDAFCAPTAWGADAVVRTTPLATVFVACSGAAGVARDTQYTVTYLTDSPGAAPPTISDIADITIGANSTTGPRPFTVGDDATSPADLIFLTTSSDLALVPPGNIVLGGAGANRTVEVTAAPAVTGSATITIYVYDSSGLVASDAFAVTVTPSSLLTAIQTGSGTGSVSSSPYGITCGLTCLAYFATGSTVTLTATPSGDSRFTGWSGGGCSGTGTCTVTMSATTSVSANFDLPPKTYYLAEGATGSFFDLDVVIANPNAFDVPVEMAFLDAAGNTYPLNFTLGAQRTRTVAVESEVPALANAEVSTIVRSPTGAPLVVERSLFWDASYYGGHTGSAVDGPQTTWYFGEGFQSAPVFDTFILLANANLTPAHVTLTFLRQGGAPVSVTRTVGATSRSNFWAAELPAELNGWSFATIVTSDIPIIAERAMYFGTPTFNGGHESAGVAAPATSWFHAEGRTGPFFDTYILVGNPGLSAAHVNVRFLRPGGAPVTTSLTVEPRSRETIYVDGIPGLSNDDVSTEVTSDVPVISERSLYWSGGVDTWYEAHNSFGVTSTGLAWGLAEGRFGFAQLFETYILLTNPTVTPTRVRVTFLRQGTRPPIVFEQLLAANARANVDMSPLLTAPDFDPAGERFGAVLESLDGVGIAVERAMYFTTGGVFWAGGTNATAVKIR